MRPWGCSLAKCSWDLWECLDTSILRVTVGSVCPRAERPPRSTVVELPQIDASAQTQVDLGRLTASGCHPPALSADRTLSTVSDFATKRPCLRTRMTRHSAATKSSMRRMSRSYCLSLVRCPSPSYSTTVRHSGHTRSPLPNNRPCLLVTLSFSDGSGRPARRSSKRRSVSGRDSAPTLASDSARSSARAPRPE